MAGVQILAGGTTEILKRLSILVANEISLAWGVMDELRKLQKTLDMILALMTDVERKQVNSEVVRRWLEDLTDMAYEAEDVLEECSYHILHQLAMTRKRDKVKRFFSSSNSIVFRPFIAHDIKNINKKFDEIANRKEIVSLRTIELSTTSHTMSLDEGGSKFRETYSIIDNKLVGRENDKSNIIKKLLHNQDENIQVIPIVGMGGLGKTTLARSVFIDNTTKNYFELRMWVCVSNDFDVKKLFVKMIESITRKSYGDVKNIDVIADHLQEHLKGKKYLLVLDDVWNNNHEEWVRMERPLMVGSQGSKILVTTRSDRVASIMGGEHHSYELGILEENDCWTLLKEQTFGHVGGVIETPTLMVIGKELVKKCEGLPLAIICLGSLLRSKKHENEWRVINENKIWDGENENKIMTVLKLSYDHLPSHLKQCFKSYFSLNLKNCKFYRKVMIELWMAEGILLQPNNKSMEEVGNDYFNSLLSNSFFQDVMKNKLGEVVSFEMHDFVHELAKYVASDRESLVLEAHENMEGIPDTRRLKLINFGEGMSKAVCKALHNKPKLRTLLVVNGSVKKIENAFDGIKRLRVLDLHEASDIEEIPSSLMDNLKHLRYLDLSCTKIASLPKSVTRLYRLQTLRLMDCMNLKELPKGIEKLINLRHLYLPDDINLPREIGQLTNLQTLYPFNVAPNNKDGDNTKYGGGGGGVGGCGIEALEELNLLNGELHINHLENVTSGLDVRRANLKRKKDLNKIFLRWHTPLYSGASKDKCDHNNDEVVLEELQPHSNLKSLFIDQYFGAKLPWWMGDPSCLLNLVHLEMSKCINCEQLVGFGSLPSLKVLQLSKMDGIKRLGNEFYYYSDGASRSNTGEATTTRTSVLFPLLKELVLSDMGSLEEWVDIPPTTPTVGTYSCFPCLEEIDIYHCPSLKITPTHFPSLKKLSLSEINERMVMPIITTSLNSLHSIQMDKISKLRFLPLCLLQGNNLRDLKVIDCLDFEGFIPNDEEGLQQQPQSSIKLLSLLHLPVLNYLPNIQTFTSLEYFFIKDCHSFKPLPEDLKCLPSSLVHLKLVDIHNVKEAEDFVWTK